MFSLSTLKRRFLRDAAQTPSILAIAMIAMIWGGIFLKYQNQSQSDYRAAQKNTFNLALLFEENALRSIGEADKVLFYLRRIIEARLGTVDYHKLVTSSDIISEIIVQVAVIDAQGIMRASSAGPQPAPAIDLSDREHYKFHLNSEQDELFVSKPVVGRASGKWSIQLTRRFRHKDGSFAGVIVASLNPEHFTQFYTSIELGSTGSISLIGLDGIVRAAGGAGGHGRFRLGQDVSENPLMAELDKQATATFVDPGDDSESSRIVTFRRVRGHPLAVSVSVAEREAYAHSIAELIRNSIIAACLTFVIFGIGVKDLRAQLRLRMAQTNLLRSQRRALQKSEQLRLTLDNMGQGIILVTKDGRIPVINKQAVKLLSLPKSFLRAPPTFDELARYQQESDEFATAPVPEGMSVVDYLTRRDASGAYLNFEHTRPDSTVLEVKSTALPEGGFVRTFTDITRHREAQAAIHRLASEDSLTGLANRRLFQQELQNHSRKLQVGLGTIEESEGFALLCLDIDRFKIINDTLGHPVGDMLLQAVAKRITKTVRTDNVTARLGGDEFAIILPRVTSMEQPEALARRLVEALARPYEVTGQHIIAECSVGIALAPYDGTDPELLLKASDMALYAAKGAGGGRHKFFDSCMADQISIRRQIEVDLRRAVENDELELYYQPQLDLKSGAISGFEALMRWRHPTKGLINPSDFIPVAEDTGLIGPLGSWALRTACLEAKNWPARLKVAVNVSSVQFRTGNLVETVQNALRYSGLPADRLELELTETILMQECDANMSTFHELRQIGTKISMDDFGTGYSSLSYLRSFPLDKIKIDRSFVKDLETKSGSDVIIRSVIDIAKSLNLTTTAEGVETPQQLKLLKSLGIDEAQGYCLSKPLPAHELPALIKQWSATSIAA